MRENRTYGLTRGRGGEATSLYSTAKKNCRFVFSEKFGMIHVGQPQGLPLHQHAGGGVHGYPHLTV